MSIFVNKQRRCKFTEEKCRHVNVEGLTELNMESQMT